jgi:hypothetical protein
MLIRIIMLNNNIYCTTRGIYGVKIYTCVNKECKILFARQLNSLMSNEMMQEVKEFYANLDENSKQNVKCKIYRNCKSIGNEENFMIWCNASLNNFITDFGK